MWAKIVPGSPLTRREQEVLALLAEGLSNKLLAVRLNLSEHTVKFHVNAVCKKLRVSTRVEAAVIHATKVAFDKGFKEATEKYRPRPYIACNACSVV